MSVLLKAVEFTLFLVEVGFVHGHQKVVESEFQFYCVVFFIIH